MEKTLRIFFVIIKKVTKSSFNLTKFVDLKRLQQLIENTL